MPAKSPAGENTMKKPTTLGRLATSAALSAALLGSAAVHAADADAAQALARQNNCFKCHSVDKVKDGPPFKETAAKYKGKPDAAEKLFKHLTTGGKAKFADGHEEEHKVIKAKEPDARNLVNWILGL
jgi:cytochrome c